ncbi:MAG: hypothetical protein HN742_33370 [Lentisphaerae bacterium]|jgi:hypothetical protein|nr:hypothetical protein [Lentisphaerota bacterium]MBT5611309.1 hypothetical protein [Lentisphaerota bacterium]MBT7054790.1 hypothetical protein [Lentisphaerota bacterium]MBT7846809.1 hypothetical protein [Lentisphaerota bacterium]
MTTPPPASHVTGSGSEPPVLRFRVQSDIVTWILQHGPHMYESTLKGMRSAIRYALAVLVCAGLHTALPPVSALASACFPLMSGLVACCILIIPRLRTVLILAMFIGLIETVLCPSLPLSLLPTLYIAMALLLRGVTDYPETRRPVDTLIVGSTVCLSTAIAGCCHAGLATGAVLPPFAALGASLLGEALLSGLVVTPLLVAIAQVAVRVEALLWEGSAAVATFTAAYFLRHVKPPASSRSTNLLSASPNPGSDRTPRRTGHGN